MLYAPLLRCTHQVKTFCGLNVLILSMSPLRPVWELVSVKASSRSLKRSECLDFHWLSHGWMINWVREQRLHPPLSVWWCRIMFWTQPDKTWWWLMRSRSYCGWIANSNPFIISLFSPRRRRFIWNITASFVNWLIIVRCNKVNMITWCYDEYRALKEVKPGNSFRDSLFYYHIIIIMFYYKVYYYLGRFFLY